MFLLYSALDENFSWYLDDNIRTFTDGQVDKQDGDFVESNIMRCKYVKQDFPIIKRLAITLMYCNRLHAWWSSQSRSATLLSSLIVRWWVGLQTL